MTNLISKINVVRVQLVKEASIDYSQEERFSSAAAVANVLVPFLNMIDREAFVVLILDTKNRIVSVNLASIGSLNQSIVHPREVFKPAVLANAAAIIVAHNHPSGDCTPSGEDIAMTKRLKEASEIMGIPLLDHLVVSGDGCYYSFAEHGQI